MTEDNEGDVDVPGELRRLAREMRAAAARISDQAPVTAQSLSHASERLMLAAMTAE